ncbi:MAG: YlbF family regulator [Lachnospiraceae bacterium]|nr:YlbF family regulator [Lachnospiraceae bacterium]
MSNVDNAVEQLIKAVLDSVLYQEYAAALAKVKQQPGLKEQIDEFRRRNYLMQSGKDCDFSKIDQFEKEFADFREQPLVAEFLAAELAFCRMMQDVNIRVTEALHFE